jgi:putative membrane protein
MKKNNFSLPQRQSQWAIIFIIFRFLRKLAMQTWPILIGLFIGKRNSQFDTFELVASGLGILGALSSIIAYFKFYYHVTDKELVIKKGLFKKVHLDLPFERIQSINFKQNFLHQLLSVTEVEIESAGSKEK